LSYFVVLVSKLNIISKDAANTELNDADDPKPLPIGISDDV
jgi:hypothetical protein